MMIYTVHTIVVTDSDSLADHIKRLMQENNANRLHSCMFIRMIDNNYEYVTVFEIVQHRMEATGESH